MNWSESLYLISLKKEVDDSGFETIKQGNPRKVFANKKSVRSQEFHLAKQQGVTLSYMFEVRSLEYKGEEHIKYNNQDYVVYRTYNKGEFTELIIHKDSDDHGY